QRSRPFPYTTLFRSTLHRPRRMIAARRKDTFAVMANSSKSYEHTGQEEVDVYVDSGVGQPDRLERIWAPFRMAYIKKRTQDHFVEEPTKSDEYALIIAL